MRLTKATIARLELPAGKSDMIVFDEGMAGFGLRLRSGGKRTWIAQFRIGNKQRRVALGSAETVSADEARRRARETLAKVSLGRDPQDEKVRSKAAASLTLGFVVEKYLTYVKGRRRSTHYADTKRYLRRNLCALSSTGLNAIDRAAVSAQLKHIVATNGPYAANRARSALSSLFSWAIGEGFAQVNPVSGTHRPAEEVSRDRILTDAELTLVWQCAGPGDFGQIVRLLILTAARAMEIAGMTWAELNIDGLQIGANRSKNRRPHDIPLAPQALAIVSTLSRREGRSLVFGRGSGPFSGWSNCKAGLDDRITAALRKMHGSEARLEPWRIHDIRRTAATRMADLGVLPHIVEAVLGHISGHKGGVAGTYNRADYLPEKRAALALWGARVEELLGRCP